MLQNKVKKLNKHLRRRMKIPLHVLQIISKRIRRNNLYSIFTNKKNFKDNFIKKLKINITLVSVIMGAWRDWKFWEAKFFDDTFESQNTLILVFKYLIVIMKSNIWLSHNVKTYFPFLSLCSSMHRSFLKQFASLWMCFSLAIFLLYFNGIDI